MKAKTKGELRGELVMNEIELAETKGELQDQRTKTTQVLVAFLLAIETALSRQPENYAVLAEVIVYFVAQLRSFKTFNYPDGDLLNEEFVAKQCSQMGFDQVTETSIKESLEDCVVLSRMLKEGKTQEDIEKHLREKYKRRQG